MTLPEFEAAAEPSVESRWGVPRFRGLSRSVYTEPHRAFVEAALAEGLSVPPRVLSDYPDLTDDRALAAPPRIDFTLAES
jgi:hypothetical protein